MTILLDLPDWTITSTNQDSGAFLLHGEYAVEPDACQECGSVGFLYRHGTKEVAYRDVPLWMKPTQLIAKVRRYKCREPECGATFLQPLGGIDAARRMTLRCIGYIQEQCLIETFEAVGLRIGCDEKTVRNVAGDYIAMKDDDYKPYLPVWIGLDETHLNKIMRAVITDVEHKRPIDMLPDRDKPSLMRWFGQFPDKSHVKGLTIDMWKPYRDVARVVFGDLPVVVDKFHVVKMANSCLEKARVRLGKAKEDINVRRHWMRSKALLRMRHHNLTEKQRFNLDMWLANEPEIEAGYRLKERLYDIYDMPKHFAVMAFDSYAATVPPSLKADFHELTRAMKNWRPEILAYFDYPITNAYTEGLNGVAKVASRMGRGYSFEVIRARVLFSGRAPSKRQVRAKVAAVNKPEAGKKPRRCECCGGLFRYVELHTFHEQVYTLCASCHRRFHMEPSFVHTLLSTRYSG